MPLWNICTFNSVNSPFNRKHSECKPIYITERKYCFDWNAQLQFLGFLNAQSLCDTIACTSVHVLLYEMSAKITIYDMNKYITQIGKDTWKIPRNRLITRKTGMILTSMCYAHQNILENISNRVIFRSDDLIVQDIAINMLSNTFDLI